MTLVPARLELQGRTPYSAQFDDVYHSAAGGPAQARHVFLQGNGLPQRWAGRERFVILETGFGLGVNFLTTWQAWRRDPAHCTRLHYVAIEKHPFSIEDLRAAHQQYPELNEEAAELHAKWPPLVSGAHRLELGNVALTLFFADIGVARELRLAADAFYLDGFAPAKNPEMWTPAVMRALSRLAARGATAATWSVAASVRQALEATGFAVEKRPGFGEKREMLVATCLKAIDVPVPRKRNATVVGAGLAGAAVCERLCSRGWEVTLVERHAEPAREASGNHAGTFHPIVTPDDSVFARLTRAGFLYGLSTWEKLEMRWDRCGVLQLARDAREEASQQRSVAGLPEQYAAYVTREEASRHAGVPVLAPGVWFPQGGWIQPRSLVDAQLKSCGERLRKVFHRELSSLDPNSLTILCNSSEAPALHPVPHLRLRRVRGQLTHIPEDALEPPHAVLLRGGMLLPPVDGICVAGATFDIDDEETSTTEESHAANLERLGRILPLNSDLGQKLEGRVSFRSVVPDRLPVIGRLGENAYGAFAYGSRGLVWAALAAEMIASELEGEPLPVEGKLADAVSPERFAKRARARAGSPGSPA